VKLAAFPSSRRSMKRSAPSKASLVHVSPDRVSPLSSRLWEKVKLLSATVIRSAASSGTHSSKLPAFIVKRPARAVSASVWISAEPAFIDMSKSSTVVPERSMNSEAAFGSIPSRSKTPPARSRSASAAFALMSSS
jgi:hypothetical protein